MPKVSVIMTYFNRQAQLEKTLRSIGESALKDIEVIIIDDLSDEEIKRPEAEFPVKIIRITEKTWTNPEPAYNKGLIEALNNNPDIIIIQNAECYHVGDVLLYATRVTDESYISFSCFSIDRETTFRQHDINEVIRNNNRAATQTGECAWYNHPEFRPVGYDFCVAMTKKTIITLNGYDERFSDGIAYGDDYLIARARMLGLKIEIPVNPFVVHQWHYTNNAHPKTAELITKNSNLLNELLSLNQPRAIHLITPDL